MACIHGPSIPGIQLNQHSCFRQTHEKIGFFGKADSQYLVQSIANCPPNDGVAWPHDARSSAENAYLSLERVQDPGICDNDRTLSY